MLLPVTDCRRRYAELKHPLNDTMMTWPGRMERVHVQPYSIVSHHARDVSLAISWAPPQCQLPTVLLFIQKHHQTSMIMNDDKHALIEARIYLFIFVSRTKGYLRKGRTINVVKKNDAAFF